MLASKHRHLHLGRLSARQRQAQPLRAPVPARSFMVNYGRGATCYFGFLVIVREKYACLVHRFARYSRTLQPGLNFKMPLIESVDYVHDMRERVVEISTQVAVTKDNVALHIDGVLYV